MQASHRTTDNFPLSAAALSGLFAFIRFDDAQTYKLQSSGLIFVCFLANITAKNKSKSQKEGKEVTVHFKITYYCVYVICNWKTTHYHM